VKLDRNPVYDNLDKDSIPEVTHPWHDNHARDRYRTFRTVLLLASRGHPADLGIRRRLLNRSL
jgi:hypothetical protein